jgi:phosphatidylserine/phosphatidylglycerophosphate/cardiolipin synthase-like enzyme/uncharacterized membrane protein YdjX (TVP38/TMEM64 family)
VSESSKQAVVCSADGTSGFLRPGHNCGAVGRARRFAMLVDGAAYYDAFRRAAERAQESILIVAWDFDSRTPIEWNERGVTRRLGDFLNSLAAQRRGLKIRILDWDYPLLYAVGRELPPIYGLGWRPHRRVELRYDATTPVAASQHQKLAVIDERVAFAGGLDFAARRWDTPEHAPADPRRVVGAEPYPPFHDVTAVVDGEAAAVLAELARARWRRATGHALPPVRVEGDPWPAGLAPDLTDVRVGVACTAPERGVEAGTREVERLYLDMIASARSYLYLENQYFTSASVAEALRARLARADAPEIVLVTRLLSHGWLEEVTMHALRVRLVRELRAADRHGRFHVYYPHVPGLPDGQCVDVHSKLAIVDDDWLRIGSANLCNRSMGLDSECDLVAEAQGRAEARAGIRSCLDRLIAEHVGATPAEVRVRIERTGSLAAAVASLGSSRGRTLLRLEDAAEWPAPVVDVIAASADPERPVPIDALLEQLAPAADPPAGRRRVLLIAAVAAVLLALALAWRFTPLAGLAAEDAVREAAALGRRWWAAPAAVAAYFVGAFLFVPRSLITLPAVVALGPATAFACAIGGSLLAAGAGYGLGCALPRDTIRRLAGDRLNRISRALTRRGVLALAAMRLVPLGPFTLQNVLAGAVRIRLPHFLAATFLGLLPGTVVSTLVGGELRAMLLGSRPVDQALLVVLAGVLALAALLIRRRARAAALAAEARRALWPINPGNRDPAPGAAREAESGPTPR